LDIIERMQAGQKKFAEKMWEERDPDIFVQTLDEAIILASIVEKETSRGDERPRIASVFENRLRKKMRLQSDPTIIYGLVGGKGALDGPITQEQLDRDTPYNTYKINGLPPTPIANPGRAAIEAVLKPAKTDDLYFVADGSGGHAFAPSLDEHNKNVARWRQIERAAREKERAEEAAAQGSQAAPADGEAAPAGTVPAGPEAMATPGALSLGSPGDGPLAAAPIPAVPGAEAAAATPPQPQGPPVPMPKRNPMR
jgi:UPF0755 protein